MSFSHWRLILNGKSAGNPAVREAVHALRGRGITLDVRVTWEKGDAERFVAEALAEGVDTVVAAGGDGTLNVVASAFAASGKAADALPSLGLVPMGTANDFATAAGIPRAPLQALELVADAPARPLDLLRVEADGEVFWCANLASGGFGTKITVETSEHLKKKLGGLAYVLTGLSRLGEIAPIQASMQGPDFSWQGVFIALGIGNGRQAGGGQVLCPEAKVDDARLDLTVIPPLEGELSAMLNTMMSEGRFAALDRVATRASLPWLEIRVPELLVLNLDGEPVHARHFRLECMPGRVRMHLPPDSPLLA